MILAALFLCGAFNAVADDAPVLDSKTQLANATYSNPFEKEALSVFVTGKEFCEIHKDVTSKENGFYVTVPVDYSDASKGTTQIWAFLTSGPFNAKLPTVIFFDGGPGGNSHGWGPFFGNYNEIHFDQRGVGCSHPDTLALYRSAHYYGNMNVVKDADQIRQFLKVEKVSLYGSSYGTVFATMYASLFAAQTIAVILDGVVYANTDTSNIHYYIQKMYKDLPQKTKDRMKSYFKGSNTLLTLYEAAQSMMYKENPFEKLSQLLQSTFGSETEIDLTRALESFPKTSSVPLPAKAPGLSQIESFTKLAMNCKTSPQVSRLVLSLFGTSDDGRFFEVWPYHIQNNLSLLCDSIFMKQDEKTYSADQYPIQAPVTYFQGTLDGATFASEATRHYKHVAKNRKQLFISTSGGHCPGIWEISSWEPVMHAIAVDAIAGKMSTKEAAKKLSTAKNKWVFTSK